MDNTAGLLLKQLLDHLKALYDLEPFRLKLIEEEVHKAVGWALADQAYDRREAERARLLPPAPIKVKGGRRESRTKTKSVSRVRESDEFGRRMAELFSVQVDKQAARARGGRSAGSREADAARGDSEQPNDQVPPTS
jgi:hypothetical protein